jgi:predicted Rossmann-fold nucleotide-binding protein
MMKIVAVVGHHAIVDPDAETFGRWLADFAVHLLTGGGQGVMAAVCRGYTGVPRPPRRGWSIGVLPTDAAGQVRQGYPNDGVEIAIRTHLHGQRNADGSGGDDPIGVYSRNHINARTADVMVAFPGASGTYAETTMAMRRAIPVLALLREGDLIGTCDAAALRAEVTAVVPTLAALQHAVAPLLD